MPLKLTVQLFLSSVTRVLTAAVSTAYNLCNQVNFQCTLGTGFHMSLSHFGQQVIHTTFVNTIQLQYVHLCCRTIKPLPLTVISHSAFATLQMRKKLQAHVRRWTGTNIAKFLSSEPEERHLFRNNQTFQGLVIVRTHVTQGGNNFQSCNVAGIKIIYKHLTLSASLNHERNYWLLPLFMKTT
jgi:hypothetical protein